MSMTENHDCALAETSKYNRRSMLLGLATAATAAACVGSPAGAAEPQHEAPELITLSEQLEGSLKSYVKARDDVDWIVAEWGPQWPSPSGEIVGFGDGCKPHQDILGRGVKTRLENCDREMFRTVGTSEYFQVNSSEHRIQYEAKMRTKSQRGAKFEKLWMDRYAAAIEPARAYWAEVDRITVASGINAAQYQKTATYEALHALVGQIMTFEERSIVGLIIKAQAMQAWSQVDMFRKQFNLDAPAWSDAMAATILRQTVNAA